jgi:hypothetical protein
VSLGRYVVDGFRATWVSPLSLVRHYSRKGLTISPPMAADLDFECDLSPLFAFSWLLESLERN